MPAWGPQPHQIGSLTVGAQGGGGPTLIIRRRFSTGTTNIVVPDRANRFSIRLCSTGGNAAASAAGGGGSAFSRKDDKCTPGQAVQVILPAVGTSYALAKVLLDGVLVCQAEGGRIGTDGATDGGRAANGVGDVRSSGGSSTTASQNGGSSLLNGFAGGGAAGERNVFDQIIYGGDGGAGPSGPGGLPGGFPGGGGGLGSSNQAAGAEGQCFIEFWSA